MVSRIALILVLGASMGCVDSSLGAVKSVDVPASQLSIEPTIFDVDLAPPDGMVSVVVQFFQGNEYVRLSSATLTANDVAVPYGSMGYTTRIPVVTSGGPITFTHTRAGTVASFTFRVPPRPTVTSPKDDVKRVRNLMITYTSADGQGVRPLASDTLSEIVGSELSDSGMTSPLDVTALHPGAGSVRVARRYVTAVPGSGFQSAAVTYTIGSLPTPVTWQ
jgi:hypothetical protein